MRQNKLVPVLLHPTHLLNRVPQLGMLRLRMLRVVPGGRHRQGNMLTLGMIDELSQ